MKTVKIILLLILIVSASNSWALPADHINRLKQLKLLPGFRISIFADNLPNARSMALGDNGVVYIATANKGKVYALQDKDNDGYAETQHILAQGLNFPNGLAYRNGNLYVGEISRITRYDGISGRLANPPIPKIIYDKLPSDRYHGLKYLRFGPDDKLYTAVGAPCNICNPIKPIFTSLVRMNANGTNFEILARGIRNTVGIDFNPVNNNLYFTDNGRDNMGDDTPQEEFNRWSGKIGEHFGYPYCHAGNVLDNFFGTGKSCGDYTSPVWRFRAHNAPLGLRFYRGGQFPAKYKNNAFVAMHGSWDRTIPDGYRVVMVRQTSGKFTSASDFVKGWLTPLGKIIGRPVDIIEYKDGTMLISDNWNGAIYRVRYVG